MTTQQWKEWFDHCINEVNKHGITVSVDREEQTVTITSRTNHYVLDGDIAEEFIESLDDVPGKFNVSESDTLLFLAYDFIGNALDGENSSDMPTCDNECTMLKWNEFLLHGKGTIMHVSIAPNTDIKGTIRVFSHDEQEMITVNAIEWVWENI